MTNPPSSVQRSHPCFSSSCTGSSGRIHLPVAPACNVSCNYCVRRFDCVNESRPGVVSKVLTPVQALERYKIAQELLPRLDVVGIAGPGDPLANFDAVSETFELVRALDPTVLLCLSTNGLLLPRYADRIAELGISHATITLNAIDPAIGARIYRRVVYNGMVYGGLPAARILLRNQIEGITRLVGLGVTVKVNTVLIPGINDDHVEEVAKVAAGLGATVENVMQMIPVPGSVFQDLPQVPQGLLTERRAACSAYLPQMLTCQQCRADAIGTLRDDRRAQVEERERTLAQGRALADTSETTPSNPGAAPRTVDPRVGHYTVAVASRDGVSVDEHFGHATAFTLYESDGLAVEKVGTRDIETFCKGSDGCGEDEHEAQLSRIISALDGCDAVLALRMGDMPARTLRRRGIEPIMTCDRIEDAVRDAASLLASRRASPMVSSIR